MSDYKLTFGDDEEIIIKEEDAYILPDKGYEFFMNCKSLIGAEIENIFIYKDKKYKCISVIKEIEEVKEGELV